MKLKAIHNCRPNSMAGEQPTLIYNLKDGFTWFKTTENNDWYCYAQTAVEAETKAREAGYDPQAICYIGMEGS